MRPWAQGPVREKLRLFWAVLLDTESYEDALWAVLEADRKERRDEWPAGRAGAPREPDGKAAGPRSRLVLAVLDQAAAAAGLTRAELKQPSRHGHRVDALHVAIRALRDEGYSYRAIGRAVGRTRFPVMSALRRVAHHRELAEAAEQVRRRARRRAARK